MKIPDLLEERRADGLSDEPISVNEMFACASNKNFEKVYRATTSHVKSLYLNRLKSREKFTTENHEKLNYETAKTVSKVASTSLKHQRANSMSTAAATL